MQISRLDQIIHGQFLDCDHNDVFKLVKDTVKACAKEGLIVIVPEHRLEFEEVKE